MLLQCNERTYGKEVKLQSIIYNEEEGICHDLGGKIADAFKSGIAFKKSLEDI